MVDQRRSPIRRRKMALLGLGQLALCLIVVSMLATSALADSRHLHVFIDGIGSEDRNAWSDPYYTSYSSTQWLQRTASWNIDGSRPNNEVWLKCVSDGVQKYYKHWAPVAGGTSKANDFEPNFTTLKTKTRWWLQFKADLNNEPDQTGYDWSNYF